MTESEIQNAILLKYGREPDLTLWRNNTGQLREDWVTLEHLNRLRSLIDHFQFGSAIKLITSLMTAPARYVRYGLCVGSSDLIGIVSVARAQGNNVGPYNKIGIMLAAELKRPGKHPTKEQQQFIDLINARGGVAGCVHSPEEFGELLAKARAR